MLVFIDESGDPGIGAGSEYLVMAMVIFHSDADVNAVDNSIQTLRQTGYHKKEFKFSKTDNQTRDAFFNTIMPRCFDVKVVIQNTDIWQNLNTQKKGVAPEIMYQFVLNNLLKLGALSKSKIRIDGKASNRAKRYLKYHKNLLNENNPGTIETLEMHDSRKDNLIQLADMVVGAVARSLHPEKKKHNRWRRKLKLKSSDLLFY